MRYADMAIVPDLGGRKPGCQKAGRLKDPPDLFKEEIEGIKLLEHLDADHYVEFCLGKRNCAFLEFEDMGAVSSR